MTPIKVGEYTVHESPGYKLRRGCLVEDGETIYAVVDQHGHPYRYVNTLPMALRVAAEAAGIERQRVEVDRYAYNQKPRGALITRAHDDWSNYRETYDLSPEELIEIGDVAHEYARERYAALGGAA